ncbi:M23 family metallopeptidase [Planktothrix sp. FACHB-1355]|uniref:M23 family metallopeptidase n=1 Tax=Aerosakkonema funiforme FACHB-1375 TaxID=2949571 RepID=A0A926VM78_9CYAN|nr:MULTISPECIES: M23 family metallopeptidase [Oscillatoriales]MBD2186505.1 M23 family metallopeptidase [Aerosakkonema funiforme FACHB-1375]MBD3561947.1 M23 family metallopeptidase [Planktothrix sp. FACHB-1355]
MSTIRLSRHFWKKIADLRFRGIAINFAQLKVLRRLTEPFALQIGLAFALTIAMLGTPARALQVEVAPANPKLGDTLVVFIQQNPEINSTPTVTAGDKTYQTFLVGSRFRAFVPTTPLEKPGSRLIRVTAGTEVQNLTVQVASRSFPTQRIRLSGGGTEPTQHELNRVSAFKRLVTPEKYWNGPFVAPNRGRISTVYGVRRYYNGVFANDYYHRGVDYAGGYGSPVVAPAGGRVALVGRVSEGFRLHGNTIGIDHGQGVTSIFLHLSRINVQEGDFVQAGQVIGAIGSTGASTGPHLHWGLYVNGDSVDPTPWRYQGIE